jgi:hypothetical protein
VPRLINTICDNCLFEAFLQKHDRVTLPIVETVAGDLGLSRQRSELFSTTLQAEHSEDIDDIGDIDEMLDSLERKF